MKIKHNNIKFVTQDLISELEKNDHPLLPMSFITGIIGRPGSGKTFLIRELLMNK